MASTYCVFEDDGEGETSILNFIWNWLSRKARRFPYIENFNIKHIFYRCITWEKDSRSLLPQFPSVFRVLAINDDDRNRGEKNRWAPGGWLKGGVGIAIFGYTWRKSGSNRTIEEGTHLTIIAFLLSLNVFRLFLGSRRKWTRSGNAWISIGKTFVAVADETSACE